MKFIFSNKNTDILNENSYNVVDEVLSINEFMFEESNVMVFLNILQMNDNKYSLFSSCILKYFITYLQLKDKHEFLFFQTNFFDSINKLIILQKEKLILINSDSTQYLRNAIYYDDEKFLDNQKENAKIEIILCLSEVFNLLLMVFKFDFKIVEESYSVQIIQMIYSFYEIMNLVIEYKFSKFDMIIAEMLQKYLVLIHFIFYLSPSLINDIFNKINAQKFLDHTYDILIFRDDYDLKLAYVKIIPYLIELIKKKDKEIVLIDNEEVSSRIELKEEGQILLEFMTVFKTAYQIKVENYDSRIKCVFNLENNNIIIRI